jgi:hypothetical protein
MSDSFRGVWGVVIGVSPSDAPLRYALYVERAVECIPTVGFALRLELPGSGLFSGALALVLSERSVTCDCRCTSLVWLNCRCYRTCRQPRNIRGGGNRGYPLPNSIGQGSITSIHRNHKAPVNNHIKKMT